MLGAGALFFSVKFEGANRTSPLLASELPRLDTASSIEEDGRARSFPAGETPMDEWKPFVLLACSMILAPIVWRVILGALRKFRSRQEPDYLGRFVEHLGNPLTLLAPVFVGRMGLAFVTLPESAQGRIEHLLTLLLIFGIGWGLISSTEILDEVLDTHFDVAQKDNLEARRVHTKFALFRRTLIVLVTIFTAGLMLMTFPAVRQLGAGLLASAGIAGIVLGVAARPTVENLIAGLQLALTDPINLDDVVIVEGEWGRIEEIGSTYVVVRIWDDRRLVLPLQYFITRPFQNWTRRTAEITGQVTLEVDYTTPVDEVRQAVGTMVESCEFWDRRFWNLQVTDAGERTMRLRVLVTAADASKAWDFRCSLREQLIGYLQEHHPNALPRMRTTVDVSRAQDESQANQVS